MSPFVGTKKVNAWHARAEDLARWAMLRLVNRTDRCGKYYFDQDAKAVRQCADPNKEPFKTGFLTHGRLARHFRATATGAVVGVYSYGPDRCGKWAALDIDNHDDKGDETANEKYALHTFGVCEKLGLSSLLYESNGRGGFHHWILFDDAVPAAVLRAFGNWLVREHDKHGFVKPPEVFPKNDGGTPWGNWLRIPGRHHTREVWPRAWNGSSWVRDAEAVAHILSLNGVESAFIPPEAAAFGAEIHGGSEPRSDRNNSSMVPAWEDYNRKATTDDVTEILQRHGWTRGRGRTDKAVELTRPGKKPGAGQGGNVLVIDGVPVFYCFTDAAAPLQPMKGYPPSVLAALLDHRGDFKASNTALYDRGFGTRKVTPSISANGDSLRNGTHTAGASEQTKPDASNLLPALSFDEIKPCLDAPDFVEDLLTSGGMSVIYGESNSGKSFFALDLALHVAMGIPWRNQEVDIGGVLYLALEGSHGIRNRIAAFKKAHQCADAELPFAVIPVSVNLLNPAADTERVIATAKAQAIKFGAPVALIVVDTLSRALSGGNENSPEDMGSLVACADRIRQVVKAHVSFIHHSGKDSAKGARGHSLLRAATDTEIEVTHDLGTRLSVARVTKQRDLERTGEFGFRLERVELGNNRRGKPVTSCVVREADGPVRTESGLPPDHQKALAVLAALIDEQGKTDFNGVPAGVRSVPETWWRERFYAAKGAASADTKSKAYRRAVDALTGSSDMVRVEGSRVWITPRTKPDI